jgi:hypothetical protein
MSKITIEVMYEKGQIIYENFPEGRMGMIIGWVIHNDLELLYEVRWLDGEKEYCISELLSDVKLYG